MNFKAWLTEAANIQFGMWAKDGTFSVYANGVRYVFVTDALYHRQIQKLAKYTPGKAMQLVNQMVKNGAAEQISPPPKGHMGSTDTQSPEPSIRPIQGTLF